jgi:hypothetical protein
MAQFLSRMLRQPIRRKRDSTNGKPCVILRTLERCLLTNFALWRSLQVLCRPPEANFRLVINLEDLLRGSFPRRGDEDGLREFVDDDIRTGGGDELVVTPRKEQGVTWITYPATVFAWRVE